MMTTKTAKIHAQRRRAATAVARELSKRGRRDIPRNEMEKDKKKSCRIMNAHRKGRGRPFAQVPIYQQERTADKLSGRCFEQYLLFFQSQERAALQDTASPARAENVPTRFASAQRQYSSSASLRKHMQRCDDRKLFLFLCKMTSFVIKITSNIVMTRYNHGAVFS